VGDPVTPHEEEALALLADDCLDGAECLYDPDLHEGPDDPAGELPAERAVREQVAAEVCAICPVHEPCFEYAVRARPARGVWAGLTAAEIGALAGLLGIAQVDGARPEPPSTRPDPVSPAADLAGDHPSIPPARPGVEHAQSRTGGRR